MKLEFDVYRVLQVDPVAHEAVVHAAYRALARLYHPDGTQPDATHMAQVNAAYALVRDRNARRQYDLRRSMVRAHAIPVAPAPARAEAGAPRDIAGGSHILDFGRYSGWRIADLARHDPDYLRWLSRHSSGIRFRESILRAMPGEPDLARRANSVA